MHWINQLKLGHFLLALCLFTGMSLGLVHQKSTLVQSGYEIEKLNRTRSDLLDQNQWLRYNVLSLRSPVVLNQRLAQEDVQLSFPEEVQILEPVQLDVPQPAWGPQWMHQAIQVASHWVGSGRQAIAEPSKQE